MLTIIACLATLLVAALAVAVVRDLVARKVILALALALTHEQEITRELRERLELLGVETIVTPGSSRVHFKAHHPPANVVALVRGWERRPRVQ